VNVGAEVITETERRLYVGPLVLGNKALTGTTTRNHNEGGQRSPAVARVSALRYRKIIPERGS